MSDPVARLNAALSGRYHVERKLGEGGMATVYLADDLKHQRKVALKVLKPELAAIVGAERFLAEIRTTASLQHPHILPLFDSGEADGLLYYVMPRVEGESLRDRLDREHQLPVEEAVRIAMNVAEALDYAHRHGVIHRDIKPANILLLDGKPVISDFGIALAVTSGGAGRMTETGLSLGTPHYMSPEQATGDQSVGPASDTWAVGCVLYELLVGEPPYAGSTPQAVLGKIITAEAGSATETRKSVPANVDAAIRGALEKLPADRFGSAGDFAKALADRSFRHGASRGEILEGRNGAHLWRRPAVAAALVAALGVGAVIGALALGGNDLPSGPGRYLNIALPDSLPVIFVGEHWTGNGETAITLSPDGQQLVYVGPAGATTRLYVRGLDEPQVRALEGTEGAYSPAFSTDGRAVAFFAGGRLLQVATDGGPVQPLAAASLPAGLPTWSSDGRVAFSGGDRAFLQIVGPGGSSETVLRRPPLVVDPHWIPGTEWILMACETPPRLCAVSSSGELLWLTIDGPPVALRDDTAALIGNSAFFVEPGYLLYSPQARNAIMGIRLDPETLETRGQPVVLIEGIRREAFGSLQVAVSRSGSLVLARGANAGLSSLAWLTGESTVDILPFPSRDYGAFALSPDNRRVAIRVYPEAATPELWFLDLVRGPPGVPWSEPEVPQSRPPWLPGSDRVVAAVGDAIVEIDARSPRGSTFLRSASRFGRPVDVAADGRVLLGDSIGLNSATVRLVPWDAIAALPDPPGDAAPAFAVPGLGALSSLSPDAQWVAYTATTEAGEQGYYEVYALRLDGASRPIRISAGAGETPRWSPRGDGLYYRNGRRFYWVPFTGSATEPFGAPRLFASGSFNNIAGAELEVSADGTALLLLQAEGLPQTTILDFIEDFRARLVEQLGSVDGP